MPRITDTYIRLEFFRRFKKASPCIRRGTLEALGIIHISEGGDGEDADMEGIEIPAPRALEIVSEDVA